MIKKVIIRDFFSFRGKNEILLNDGINITCGINGSGKTSFLKDWIEQLKHYISDGTPRYCAILIIE